MHENSYIELIKKNFPITELLLGAKLFFRYKVVSVLGGPTDTLDICYTGLLSFSLLLRDF